MVAHGQILHQLFLPPNLLQLLSVLPLNILLKIVVQRTWWGGYSRTVTTTAPNASNIFAIWVIFNLNWSRSSSVQVQATFSEPAPQHSGLVQPIIKLEPAHQGSGSAGSVQVHT